jgi:hypothetical protein
MEASLRAGSTRHVLAVLVALIAIAIAIPTAGADANHRPSHNNHSHKHKGKNKGKVPADFFGISAQHPDHGDFVGMGKAGFGTYRASINWAAVQPTRDGAYNWAQPDAEIRSATENGLRPVPVVYGMPSFIHAPSPQNLYPPVSDADLSEWQDFTEAVAARYGPGGTFFDSNPGVDDLPVKTWIIWNEQNVEFNWRPKPDAAQYAELVERADAGISAVDPKADLVLGGMFGYPGGDLSVDAPKYLRDFYKVKGIKRHFEAVNVHPYGHGGLPDVKKQITDLRRVAKRAGDGKTGTYIGEIGWASSGPKRSDLVVGKKGQAKILKRTLQLLIKKRKSWKVDGVLIYAWRDFPSGEIGCDWCSGAGLVKQNRKPKPSLRAVQKLIRSHVK